jgi:FMN-dependent NADH-azoreductase
VKLLEIQSSPRGESSDLITLTESFIEACKSGNTSIVVDTLNVWQMASVDGLVMRVWEVVSLRSDCSRARRVESLGWRNRAPCQDDL